MRGYVRPYTMQTSAIVKFFGVISFLLFSSLSSATCENDQSPTDQSVVVAIDVSSSIDELEMSQQMQGYKDTFLDPEVQEVFLGCGCSEVTILFWGTEQAIARETAKIKSEEDLVAIASFFEQMQNTKIEIKDIYKTGFTTEVRLALQKSIEILNRLGNTSFRKSIVISGDGPQNDYTENEFLLLRSELRDLGIGVFAAPIYVYEDSSKGRFPNAPEYMDLSEMTPAAQFYKDHVVSYPSYLEVAESFKNIGPAISRTIKKLTCLAM